MPTPITPLTKQAIPALPGTTPATTPTPPLPFDPSVRQLTAEERTRIEVMWSMTPESIRAAFRDLGKVLDAHPEFRQLLEVALKYRS